MVLLAHPRVALYGPPSSYGCLRSSCAHLNKSYGPPLSYGPGRLIFLRSSTEFHVGIGFNEMFSVMFEIMHASASRNPYNIENER